MIARVRLHHRVLFSALMAVLGLPLPSSGGADPAFDAPPAQSTAGFFALSWNGAQRFELEQASGPDHGDARIIYRGRDTSTTISGLPDGTYRYRIRAEGAEAWTDETVVVIAHHPLRRAFLFFALGAAIFVVLVLAIVRGRRLA